MNIQEFRQQYPQYNDLSDQALADSLYNKHYSDMDRQEFDSKFLSVTKPVEKAPQPQSDGGSILNPLAQGVAFQFADELAAAGGAAYGKLSGDHPDKSFGEIYTGIRDQIRADDKAYAQRNPKTALGAEIVGGLATGGTIANAAGRVGNIGKLRNLPKTKAATVGATTGAVEGGLYGAGKAEQDVSAEAVKGAATGAAFGAPIGMAADKIGRTLAERAIASRIKTGSGDKDLAPYELAKFKLGGIKNDKAAQKAIEQGFDDGLIQQIKTASKGDRAKMRQMVNVAKASVKDNRYAIHNRINQVIGDSLAKRVDLLKTKMDDAAGQLDSVAKRLKDVEVDHSGPMQRFIDDLRDLDVGYSNQGGVSIDLRGSMIEGADDAERTLKLIVGKLAGRDAPQSAYDIHRVKRLIDNMVVYGKGQEKGLKGEVLGAVKRLRHNLNEVLRDASDEYRQVNTQYSDHRQALEMLQDAWGGKVNMFGDSANKQLGIQSRKLLSNYAAGTNQMDAIENAERIIQQYGNRLDDNIMELVSVESALRSVVPQKLFNTFQGDIEKASGNAMQKVRLASGDPTAAAEMAGGVLKSRRARRMAEKYTPEKALDALMELLTK